MGARRRRQLEETHRRRPDQAREVARDPQETAVTLSRRAAILSWTLQIIAAAILAQTLFFKFAGAEESVHIFRTLGLEPAGRIGSGVAELIAVVLLLTPR